MNILCVFLSSITLGIAGYLAGKAYTNNTPAHRQRMMLAAIMVLVAIYFVLLGGL